MARFSQSSSGGGNTNTGDITFNGVQIIGAGNASSDGLNAGTMQLVPDANLGTDQYLIIDPTSPNHIHIRPGGTLDGSTADLIMGGERTQVLVSDTGEYVDIKTTSSENFGQVWRFGADGILTGPAMGSVGVGGLYNNPGNDLYIGSGDAVVITGTDGEFLNDSNNPDNQIATVADVAAVSTGSLTSVGTNILPSTDDTYTLGDTTHRWQSMYVGPGTLYITDQTLGTDAEITVDNGVLKINGANQLQVGQLKFNDNNIESTTPEIDIEIGLIESTGNLIINRNVAIPKTLTVGNADASTNAIMLSGLPLAGQIKSEVFGFGQDLQTSDIILQRHSTIVPAIIAGAVSNSDTTEDASVSVGQNLLMLMANGYAGNDYKNFANILLGAQSEGTPDISDLSSPGRIEFQVTPDGETVPNTVMTIRSNGLVQHSNGNLWGATAPTSSLGSTGDEYGMIAFDEDYIYYCAGNYSSGTVDIWKRVALTGGTW